MGNESIRTFQDKIIWKEAYLNDELRKVYGRSLIVFGLPYFYDAFIIKNVGELRRLFEAADNRSMPLEHYVEGLKPFAMGQLLDDIRICIFFENLMKARLLFEGKVIHSFDDRSAVDVEKKKCLKKLNEQLRTGPLDANVIATYGLEESDFSHQTLPMSRMLTTSYNAIVDLPEYINEVVSGVNARRNRLHLSADVNFPVNKELILGYENLILYTDLWRKWHAEILERDKAQRPEGKQFVWVIERPGTDDLDEAHVIPGAEPKLP